MELGDCNLGAASYLLKDKGLNITPEMCFGIGEGYGFSFWVEKSNRLPIVVIMGRTRSCEENLFRKCGFDQVKIGSPLKSSNENSLELERLVNQNQKVCVQVDRYYIPRLREKFGASHCGAHCFVVASKSPNTFSLFDSLLPQESEIEKEVVALGRSSTYQPFSPEFNGYYIEGLTSRRFEIDKNLLYTSVQKNMEKYRQDDNSGLRALFSFKNQFNTISGSLPSVICEKFLGVQIGFLIQLISELEETHSFYRGIYKNFLIQAQQIGCTFESSIQLFEELEKRWVAISNKLYTLRDFSLSEKISILITFLDEVYELEDCATKAALQEARAGIQSI